MSQFIDELHLSEGEAIVLAAELRNLLVPASLAIPSIADADAREDVKTSVTMILRMAARIESKARTNRMTAEMTEGCQ